MRGRAPGFSKRQPGQPAVCSTCGEEKPPEAFRIRTVAGYRYLRSQCKACEQPAVRAAIAQWVEKNRSRVNAWRRNWAAETGKPAEHYRKWRTAHRAEYNAMKRVRRRRAHGSLTLVQWVGVVAAYAGRCAYCAAPWEHLDHVVPISRGGRHELGNVVPACAACNLRKNKRTPAEWLGPTPSGSPPLILLGQGG